MSFFRWCLFVWVLLIFSGCSKYLVPAQYGYTKIQVESKIQPDSLITTIISPYKDSLDKTMTRFIVSNEVLLSKGQPESTLGNLLADALLRQGNSCCNQHVDFALLNNGGIRVAQLAKGEVTLGKIYEIMPFDNRLVLIKLTGEEVQSLLNSIAAAGGWPISGARFTIKDKMADSVFINGAPIDISKTYTVALSDYLTEGGDNLSMLKGKPIIDSGRNIREAFIDEFSLINARGEQLRSKIDGRISEQQ